MLPPPNPPRRLRSRFLLVFALIFFLEPDYADLHPARVFARGLSTFILQRFVLIRSLSFPLPSVPSPVCVASVVQQSPHGPLHFVPPCAFFPCSCLSICPPPPLLFMPEPRRRRQRAAALLQSEDIPGLTKRAAVAIWPDTGTGGNDVRGPCFGLDLTSGPMAREGRREVVVSKRNCFSVCCFFFCAPPKGAWVLVG